MVLQHYVVISELFLIFFYIVDIKNANMTHKMSGNLNIRELSQKADQWVV